MINLTENEKVESILEMKCRKYQKQSVMKQAFHCSTLSSENKPYQRSYCMLGFNTTPTSPPAIISP